ncbi:hypothetical protein DWZ20_13355 [Clostridium perfringens]|uniref:hypothetical protein n=1 Tax=Clostridium perfringens TaxID=1502 RepID=UPI000E54531A|nr:hypothetical protein [Clostridium perfringens]RHN23817.1 hypothetical protein DWZ20_13355 [Clostridium perfringens]
MKDIHIKTRNKKNSINEIKNIRKRIYDNYMCDLNDCNLDIETDRIYINSLKDKQNNPLLTGAIASVVGVIAGIILPPCLELFSKPTSSFQISFPNIIAFIITLGIILVFLVVISIFYYFVMIKDIFKIYKKYLKKNTYYDICLEVLDEIEEKIKEREKEKV